MNPDRTERKESNRLSVSDLLPALASPAFSSTVRVLRENAAFQSFTKRFSRRTMSSPEMCWPVPMRAIGAQNLLTMPGGVSTAGYLHKKGGSQFSLMKWPLRYIIIHKGCVYYFKSSTSPAPQGAFSLNGYNRVMRAAEETTSSNVFPFKIVHFSKKHRTWFFSAASEDERRKWMRYLRREIDYYNDRKESHISSDSDSDADSFYGTIERPMEIKHPVETTEHDYVDEDDDEDEEDYVKPDNECSLPHPDRPLGPPPSYPPPPVPSALSSRQDPSSSFQKGLLPPIPPQHRIPTSPLPKKPPPHHPPPIIPREATKGPPPPPPPSVSSMPKSSSPNSMTDLQNRVISQSDKRDWTPHPSVSVHCPATLPICENLREKVLLNGPVHHPQNFSGTQSLGPSCPRVKPSLPLRQPANTRGSPLLVNQTGSSPTQLPGKPTLSPVLNKGTPNKPAIPKLPPPSPKPPLPTAKPRPRTSIQRPSPDGQSFRLLVDEKPVEFRRKRDVTKHGTGDDSDDDYENVQLPNSVFIDSTETSFVEKLFREAAASPPDGLYGIRNSGTKTSKVLVVWDSSINKARNYRLFEESDSIYLENDVTFPNLSSLIEHYHRCPLPHHDSLCLQLPYTQTLSS